MAIIKVKAQQKNLIDKADDWYGSLGKEKIDMDEDKIFDYLLGNIPSKGWKFTKDKIINNFGEAGARVFDKFLSLVKKKKSEDKKQEEPDKLEQLNQTVKEPLVSGTEQFTNYAEAIRNTRKVGAFINEGSKFLTKIYNLHKSMKEHSTTIALIFNALRQHADVKNQTFNANQDSQELMAKLEQARELLKEDVNKYKAALDKAFDDLVDFDVGNYSESRELKNLK